MKAMLMATLGLLMAGAGIAAEPPKAMPRDLQAAQPAPLFQLQRRSTPDTSTPGSTAPGNPMTTRRHSSRTDQYYAAELRRCETIGDVTERLACKESVRDKFGEL